ncbi:MAG: aminoglycoside phosphotransferase family protein [Pseudomonadota bacterium]
MPAEPEPPRLAVSDNDIRLLMEKQFPQWKALDIERIEPGGWDNHSFRLGSDRLVRLPSAERYAFQVAREQQWLPHLAPHLPLAIPEPLAEGRASAIYPWPWSVHRWIAGAVPPRDTICHRTDIAHMLAHFLIALQGAPVADAPMDNPFGRGQSPRLYDAAAREAINRLVDWLDAERAIAVWERALLSDWQEDPIWVHGDISLGNLLWDGDQLVAVIDFGNMAIGDPSCDLVAAWTIFEAAARETFRDAFALDAACWSRARGWALWKALITLAAIADKRSAKALGQLRIIDAVIADTPG